MKKFAKLSLVAAVAVVGLSSANAGSLEEAVKNTDISGTVVYRYNDYADEATGSSTVNHYKVGVSLSSKINDDMKFNSRFLATDSATGSLTAIDTQAAGDSNLDITLSHANFSYTGFANTTVTVGKQGLQTPWTNAIDSDGSEQTGTGVLGMTTMGPVTAAAGYFNQTNVIADGSNLVVAGLLGKLGAVNAQAWYLDIDEATSAYFVKADGSIDLDGAKLSLFAQYADKDDDANSDDLSLLKVGVGVKAGIFGAGYKYATTGDQGSGIVNAVSMNSAIGWNFSLHDEAAEVDAHFLNVNAQVMPQLNIALNYNLSDSDVATSDEEEELYTQITWKPSANFYTYIRLGEYTADSTAKTESKGRLQVEYKF